MEWEREVRDRREYNDGKERWQAMRNAKTSGIAGYIKKCGVPKIFLDAEVQKTDKVSVFLTGACGTGKTYKAVGMLKYLIKQLSCEVFWNSSGYIYPIFITVPELLMKIRSCFSLNECEEIIVSKYSACPMLILDDIGVEKTSEWALQTLYIILNNRYSNQLQTIITSNLTIEEIGNKLGDRIASRIAGMCKIVKLAGRDRRIKKDVMIA